MRRWAVCEVGRRTGRGRRRKRCRCVHRLPKAEYWAYADYKYIAEVFKDQPSMFEAVKWSDFGFSGRSGRESTLWIGTEGANTPCHLDSYGCNLVLQVQGRKRWHLFPPDDTSKLYPTRIPYEESSVFSRVDVLNPDLNRFKDFRGARVLFVPRHWWHYVESVDLLLSLILHNNVYMCLYLFVEDVDDEARVSEAVTRAVVCAFKTAHSEDNTDQCSPHREVSLTCPGTSSLPNAPTATHFNPFSPLSPRLDLISHRCHVMNLLIQEVGNVEKLTIRLKRKRGNPRRDSEEREELNEDLKCVTVSTNDLLEVLVHPEVVKHVTELLIQRHTGRHRRTALD
ncbi:hypothetical protein WMY93_028849 [Mugilogobius chulae]|uniref:JmjC domain-containing protein n=1 Tax=Mugilogobius chulae TaxID=88201 RepID=A0AAW0MRG3_9GOBI